MFELITRIVHHYKGNTLNTLNKFLILTFVKKKVSNIDYQQEY